MTAPGISTDHIDRIYDDAFAEGALARKVFGAGGSGFVVFLVQPEGRLVLLSELNTVKFAERGCEP